MLGAGATLPLGAGSGTPGGGSSGYVGRDIVWVDLRFNPGSGDGSEARPYNAVNLGLPAVPDGGTLMMVGGDASTEPGLTIGARSFAVIGLGAQLPGGTTAPPALPTLTYGITSGAQRLAFERVSAAIVHSGTATGLTSFCFVFCPVIQLTAGGDTAPVYCFGDRTCSISGSGGAAHLRGIIVAGYVANGGGQVFLSNAHVTSDVTSTTAITFHAGCTFGGALSITAPSISIDAASHKNAVAAGVTFSSTAQLLAVFGTPVDVGTANSPGTQQAFAHADHGHNLPFSAWNAAAAAANAPISVNGQKITGAGAPTTGTDLTTKTYVDSVVAAIASGLNPIGSVVALRDSNLATLSGTAQTADGVTLTTIGSWVLLTGQTTASQNGVWAIQSGAWTRPTAFPTGGHAKGTYVLVGPGGTTYKNQGWYDNNGAGSDVIDTNALTWVQFSAPNTYSAGFGLSLTGSTFAVVPADPTIVSSGSGVAVGVIGNANLADNTIALPRLANAGAQYDFMMRKTAGSGPWEDATLAQAQAALGITASALLKTVRAATTGNITLSGTQTIDGVACIAGDRVLAWKQTTGSQNGVYVVAAGAWARASDASSAGQLFAGVCVPIGPEGTTQFKRVAMLVTADPITIGTTALTFAMDRIVPVASVAPQDITNGAAQIGTGVEAARADHVHTLTFTGMAAILAAASASISVNSQKIASLGTPTVSTDAATKGYVDSVVLGFAAPANPGDNGKIAYANAGALAYATNIKTDGTRYQFGTTGTGGLLNFAQSSNIAFGANNAGTQVVPLMRWGSPSPVALVDGLYIGSTSGDAGKVAAMRFGVHTGGGFQWEVNGGAAATLASGGMSILQGAVTSGIAPVALLVLGAAHTGLTASSEPLDISLNLTRTVSLAAGAIPLSRAMRITAPTYSFASASTISVAATLSIATPPLPGTNATITNSLALLIENGAIGLTTAAAQSGLLRAPGNSLLLAARGTVGGYDVPVASVDASDHLVLGGSGTNSPTTNYYNTRTAGLHIFQVNATDLCSVSATIFDFKSLVATFGAAPSSGGTIRLSSATDIRTRNAAGSGDITMIRSDGSDNVLVGATGAGGDLYLDAASGKTIWIRFAGGTQDFRFTSTLFDLTNNYAQWTTASAGSTAVSGIGLERFTGSPGVIMGARGFDNTSDTNILGLAGDGSTFADLRLGDDSTKGNNALYLQSHGFAAVRLASANEYVYFTTYMDFTDNQARFGSNPSTNALLNFTNNSTVAAGKDSGGTERNLLVWTSGNVFQVGSGNITSVQLQSTPGNIWTFGGTAAFPGVLHAFAAGATLAFGTASTNATINFASSNTVLLGAKNASSTDRALLSWSNTDAVTFGSSALTTIVAASGGNWQFSSTASFPGVEHSFASGAFLTLASSTAPAAPGGGGRLYAENGALKWISSSGRITTMGFA